MSRKKKPSSVVAQSHDLRFGRWQDVLVDVVRGDLVVDSLITDPPYGARTHASRIERNDGSSNDGSTPSYAAWTAADVDEFVGAFSPRVRDWMVVMTSHDLIPAWEAAYERAGRICFAPVSAVIRGMTTRMHGDGPPSWTIHIIVARPRHKRFIGAWSPPGGYCENRTTDASGGRGKPDWLCNALVRDYSRVGDLVCDPMAGWSTTLVAALANGRRAIGAEMDRDAYDESCCRLRGGVQLDMLAGVA